MKKFYLTSWIVFLLGLLFKFLHYPGGGILLTLGSLLLVIHCIIHFTKFAKTDLPLTLLYASIAFITVYLFGRLQYWAFAKPFFLVAFLLSLATIILLFVKKVKFGFPQLFLIVYFVFFFIISYTASYRIYYFINLNTVLNSESRNTDYASWDKYSWFLYLQEKQEEAIEANTNAKNAVVAYLKISSDKEAEQFSKLIEQHEQQIQERSWVSYP